MRTKFTISLVIVASIAACLQVRQAPARTPVVPVAAYVQILREVASSVRRDTGSRVIVAGALPRLSSRSQRSLGIRVLPPRTAGGCGAVVPQVIVQAPVAEQDGSWSIPILVGGGGSFYGQRRYRVVCAERCRAENVLHGEFDALVPPGAWCRL